MDIDSERLYTPPPGIHPRRHCDRAECGAKTENGHPEVTARRWQEVLSAARRTG